MTAGYLPAPIKFATPVKGGKPFFVVGNDEMSTAWIEKNKSYLLKIGAQGFATNLANKDIFLRLSALASPLPLTAMPLDEFEKVLHFSVYPVLVTSEEIAQ